MFYKLHALVYRKDFLTETHIFNEICSFITSLPNWPEKPTKWLIANPVRNIIAVENGMATKEGSDYVREIIKSKDVISIVLADENEDESILTISFKNTPAISSQRYLISLTIKSLISDKTVNIFVDFIKRIVMLGFWEYKYVIVDTEQYKRKQRCVFHDRLSVGWMIYLPIKIERENIPSAFLVTYLDGGLGTIIVSKDVFDGKDSSDVICANNVEIELASNGLLPLIKGL